MLFVGRGLAPAACLKSHRLKPRPLGEVAAIADGEGCRDFRPLDCVGYLLFSGEEKRSKKVAGDYYRDCVPDPATLFGRERKTNACFLL